MFVLGCGASDATDEPDSALGTGGRVGDGGAGASGGTAPRPVTGGASGGGASGAPCALPGGEFAFGVSSFGSLRQWALDASEVDGARLDALYVYVLDGGMENPDDFRDWYLIPFVDAAESIGATPFFTFYQLLDIGRRHGLSGSEPEVVEGCLGTAACMADYFANFAWFLDVVDAAAPEAVVQVEPDSWGFMMWAMGVEGNDDAHSVRVEVAASGYSEVAGFADDAAGFGQALLALRDRHAPRARMGWHASNFRVGTRPEVVTSFFAPLGRWDLLVTDGPHNDADPSAWWLPWDAELEARNLAWMAAVTGATGLPLVLWQLPIGTYDYHLLGNDGALDALAPYAEAGVVAALFDHQAYHGEQDPDAFRGEGELGAIPPADSDAGGTAADLRARLATYATHPLALPPGTPCAAE